jgi:hypothetical protein
MSAQWKVIEASHESNEYELVIVVMSERFSGDLFAK